MNRKLLFFFLPLLLCDGLAFGQTLPSVYSLSSGAHSSFTSWAATSTAGTYPPNNMFQWLSSAEPAVAITTNAIADYTCAYNLTSRSRITGLGTNGISIINTSAGSNTGCTAGGSDLLGDAILGLNTTGQTAISVSFVSGTATPGDGNGTPGNPRIYKVRLQCRVGSTGAYADVLFGLTEAVGWVPFLTAVSGSSTGSVTLGSSATVVGKGGRYRPVIISAPAAATDVYTGEYFNAPFSNRSVNTANTEVLDHVSFVEYRGIARTVSNSSGAVDVPLTYGPGSDVDQSLLSTLRLAHYNGATWDNLGIDNTTSTTITKNGVTAFSPFTLGTTSSAQPLPLQLLAFTGKPVAEGLRSTEQLHAYRQSLCRQCSLPPEDDRCERRSRV